MTSRGNILRSGHHPITTSASVAPIALFVLVAMAALSTPIATAMPSFPAAPSLGFAPNPSGGDGSPGSTSPYVPGSTQVLTLAVPFQGPRPPFNGSDDSTVDVKVFVPDELTGAACGTATKLVHDGASGSDQPGATVAGWTCAIDSSSGHTVVHFAGPQVVSPATVADSAQFFSLTLTMPSPADVTTYDGTQGHGGFIVDQKYASAKIYHWIPSDDYIGIQPPDSTTIVAAGLSRSVGGPGLSFQSVPPHRILDSRTTVGAWPGQLGPSAPRALTVAGGTTTVPLDAQAVVMNVTVTNGTTGSFLTAYPWGQVAIPVASNLNFGAGQTIPNLVTVKVGLDHKVAILNALGSVDVIADVVGYYAPTATKRFNPLDPTRVLDTRTSTGGSQHPVVAGAPLDFDARAGGVPATADSVLMNVTATGATTNSFLTVYPSGGATPTASNLNFGADQTIANLVSVKLAANGHITFANHEGAVDVVADVVGYYDATKGNFFHVQSPNRILDSRLPASAWAAPLVADQPRVLQVRGVGGVRLDASAVVANATVTGSTANSFLSVYPAPVTPVPNVSNLNFATGQTIPNLVTVKLGTGGQLAFDTNAGATNVVFDVVGFFAAA